MAGSCVSVPVSLDLHICVSAVWPEAEREGDKPGHVWWGRLARSPLTWRPQRSLGAATGF